MYKRTFQILNIKTCQFAIFPENYTPEESYEIMSSYGFAYTNDISRIKCDHIVKFFQKKEKILLKVIIECQYLLSAKESEEFKNKKLIPKDFIIQIAAATTGITRGVIHAKTEGTPINHLILHPIKIEEIINEDIELQIKQNS